MHTSKAFRAAPLVWASRVSTGMAVHVTEVQSGLACECRCPGCEAELEAVNSQNPYWKNRPHFRHYKAAETEACGQTAVLAVAMAVLAEVGAFQLPDLVGRGEAKSKDGKPFEATSIEHGEVQEVSAYEFVDETDAILTLKNGEQVYVQLTARPLAEGLAIQKQNQLAEIIIQIDDPVLRTADWDTMRRHIRLSPSARTWCRNPRLVQLNEMATAQANEDAARHNQTLVAEHETNLAKLHRLRKMVSDRQSLPHASRTTQTALDRWRVKYQDGGDIHSAPRIDFQLILAEARQAQSRGESIHKLIPGWLSHYKLEGRPEALISLLNAGGFRVEMSVDELRECQRRASVVPHNQ